MKKRDKFLWFSGLTVLAIFILFLLIAAFLWSKLYYEKQIILGEIIKENGAYLFIISFLFFSAFAFAVNKFLNIFSIPMKKLADETAIITTSNPSHRIKIEGVKIISNLARLINELAELYEKQKINVAEEIKEAKANIENEKNILAALIDELPYGVLACDIEGRIILFNKEAKIIESSNHLIGIGRTVFGIIDMDLITHALYEINIEKDEKNPSESASFLMISERDMLIKVKAASIVDKNKDFAGFMLILYDMTSEMESAKEAFKESKSGYIDYMKKRLPLLKVSDRDIMTTVRKRVKEQLDISLTNEFSEKINWIKVESYSFISALLFIMMNFKEITGIKTFHCKVAREKNMLAVLFLLTDNNTAKEVLKKLNDPVLIANNHKIALTLTEIIKYNEGILTIDSSCIMNRVYLKLLMPLVEIAEPENIKNITLVDDRPEYYDFDLFSKRLEKSTLSDYRLTDITYTVFDTETTGLDTRIDEIISIGALRIVNNKLLFNEQFDQLIYPRMLVSWESQQIHGISTQMLEEKPPIEEALPMFHLFAEETVLIGHNVGFDMKMFEMKEKKTGIKFNNPVLDTMILAAIVYPSHKRHNMEILAELTGVKIIGRHTAIGDAIAAGQIFIKLIPLLEKKGIYTLKEAIEASKKTWYAKLKY